VNILVLNPGGNSLKVEVVDCDAGQEHAYDGKKLVSVSAEGIGKNANFLRYEGKKVVHTEPMEACDYGQALDGILSRLGGHDSNGCVDLASIACVGVRVVHGGPELTAPTEITAQVEEEIVALEKLAPLHNKSSIEVLGPARRHFGRVPIFGVFDTAFHRTIPEYAFRYAIPVKLADRHRIRRYGFHGISHRYLLERYAHLAAKPVEECNLVSMHLESGCSVTAIRDGKSIDNTMGMTPLEGLMMGTRCGDIDPSVASVLVQEEGMTLDEVMTMFNKESGLKGVSELSLDTRILMQQYNSSPKVKLAMDMFSYRVLKAVGANLAAVGEPEAVIFGGGIAENTKLVRQVIGNGLRWCGLHLDEDANERLIDIEGRLSTADSPLQAWVIPVEEGLQIAHECCQAAASR
jgi:acetate kinase